MSDAVARGLDSLTTASLAAKLAERIAHLEEDSHELGEIRATLKLNFGTSRNKWGVDFHEHPRTMNMLMQVLEQLTKKVEDQGNKP